MEAEGEVKQRTVRRKKKDGGEVVVNCEHVVVLEKPPFVPGGRRPTKTTPQMSSATPPGLDKEIGMVRGIIRRVVRLADEGLELGELMSMLDTVGKASTRLATLLKAQRALGEANGLAASIDQALAQVIRELRDEG